MSLAKATQTQQKLLEQARAMVVSSRRRAAEELKAQAASQKGTERYVWLKLEAFIASWEANEIEKNGVLPEEYMDLLKEIDNG